MPRVEHEDLEAEGGGADDEVCEGEAAGDEHGGGLALICGGELCWWKQEYGGWKRMLDVGFGV